ncbi:hypothetical protein GJ496_009679 [Pomphorhynchus laevis]|nr:hypothetical protein GJ496_009679 [Pomphorhynchus laevis]
MRNMSTLVQEYINLRLIIKYDIPVKYIMSMLMNRIFRNTTFESNSLLTINGTVQDIDINGTIERNYEKTHL